MDITLVLVWYAAVLLLAGLATPVTAWLFPDWPDRGVSLAPAVAFVVLTVVAYWVGQVAFGQHALWIGLGVLVVAGAVALWRGPRPDPRTAGVPLAVFTVTFALLVVLRGLNPAIGPFAGEQFLDFGLINAIQKTGVLPPTDIWFGGERMRYYYGGPLLSGLLAWLTDTPTRYAFNLMHPVVFGSLATAAYGLASAIAADRDLPRRSAGILGGFFVAFSGPVAIALRGLSSYLPKDLVTEYGRVLFVGPPFGFERMVTELRFLDGGQFGYWLGRRIIPHTPNVYPFWTYVNGDLRPHMYAGPFLLLAAALCFAVYRTDTEDLRRRRALLFGAFPVVAALLTFTNTFDLPAVLGVAWLTLVFADGDPLSLLPERVTRWGADAADAVPPLDSLRERVPGGDWLLPELRRAVAAVAVTALVGAIAALWTAPFLLDHTAQNEGLEFFGPTSSLGGLLLVYGGFLALFAMVLWTRATDGLGRRPRLHLAGHLVGFLALTTLIGNPALGLFGPLILGGWWVLRTDRARGFDVVLVVAGAGLVLFPELAYAAVWPYDPNAPRWNTVYKISMQVWAFWGVAAGVAAVRVLARVRARIALDDPEWRRRAAGATLALVVLVSMATFPFFAVWNQTDPLLNQSEAAPDVELSLNGTEYAWKTRPNQMEAVEWLRTEVEGQPTMVSKPTNDSVYRWAGGTNLAATFSGVPTVAGWRHAAGYHGADQFDARVPHAEAIYEAEWDVARTSLRLFDVQYIYVGPTERDAYDVRNFAATSEAITVAYENQRVTIYRVDQAALARGE